jgi:hypothetical protein
MLEWSRARGADAKEKSKSRCAFFQGDFITLSGQKERKIIILIVW